MASHSRLLKLGLDTHPVFSTRLLIAYASTSLSDAHQLFDQIPHKDIILWTSLISSYTRSNHPNKALHLFSHLHHLGHPKPNHFAFATVARACAATSNLTLGQTVHGCIVKHGLLPNVIASTSILDMYAKCCSIEFARKLFDDMPLRNGISWNAMISGYVLNGMPHQALDLFYKMKCVEYEEADEVLVSSAITACATICDLKSGAQIHAFVVRSGIEVDPVTTNSVCNMYFRCGKVDSAEKLVKGRKESLMLSLIMIKGYAYNGRYRDVITKMGHKFVEVVAMDKSVVVSVLNACAKLSLLGVGRQVHDLIITAINYQNCQSEDDTILTGALIDMYCKCSSVEEAQRVFNSLKIQELSHWNSMVSGCIHNNLLERAKCLFSKMPEKNVISWTAMISGHVQSGSPRAALRLLRKMCNEDSSIRGNCFTFATALGACSLLTAVDAGKQIHTQFIQTLAQDGIENMVVESALVDMYSKSGNLSYARKVFDGMRARNVVSWTSMIMGYSIHGFGSQALECFDQMVKSGLVPNEVTFIAVFSACSHCGLVEEGMRYFKLMREKYGIVPKGDHYACMVDLLGRAGKLVDAYNLIEEIKEGENRDGGAIMGALLSGCQLHGNVEMGAMVAKRILERKQQVSETYIALSNVYASADKWDQAYGVRKEWRSHGAKKEPGCSVVSVRL